MGNYIKRTRVKICGITRIEDAITVANAGADAIGFIFYEPSVRYIALETAVEIVQALPLFVHKIGVFVNASDAQIDAVLNTATVDILQFHGEEDPEMCERYGLPYIKAIRMQENIDINRLIDDYASASALLLDSCVDSSYGGTGRPFLWSSVPVNLDKRIILAGGLTAENVAHAIAEISPYAVDVSSGVEITPGIKDPDKIKKFIHKVMAYEE